jgi:hypothetical protein
MGGYPSQPVAQNLAALWGGRGFGGIGSPGAVPQGPSLSPSIVRGAWPDVNAPQANPGAVPGGIDPSRDFNYAAPGTTGGAMQTMGASQPPPPPDLWDRLMRAVGQSGLANMKMPGTTIGAPAGGQAPPPPPPMRPQPPAPAPPGMAAYFRALQQGSTMGGGLQSQLAALQQLMRGS